MADKKSKSNDAMLDMIKGALGIAKNRKLTFADQYEAVKDVISTGVADLDRILTPFVYDERGVGGIPCGFVAEFFGPYAGGKSSLSHMLAGTVTKNNGFVFWMDIEGSYVNNWAEKHGVDTSKVILWNVEKAIEEDVMPTGEWYLEKLEAVVGTGAIRLAVVDSVSFLQPKDILEGKLADEARVAAGARMMTRFMPRLIAAAKRGNCAVVLINQIRNKIGVVYGNPETTPFGEAIKHAVSIRLRFQRVTSKGDRGIIKEGTEIGMRTNAYLDKSRFGPANREAILPIYYGSEKPHPIDTIIDAALSARIIKSHSKRDDKNQMIQHFRYGDDIKCIGIDYLKEELIDKRDILIKLASEVVKTVAFQPDVVDYIASLSPKATEPAPAGAGEESDPGA